MRLIDADALISGLAVMYSYAGWGDKEVHLSLKDMVQNIDEASTVDVVSIFREYFGDGAEIRTVMGKPIAGAWIPVEQALPRDGQTVLVTIAGHSDRLVDQAWMVNGEWRGLLSNARVIAWMPRPLPYKGGGH